MTSVMDEASDFLWKSKSENMAGYDGYSESNDVRMNAVAGVFPRAVGLIADAIHKRLNPEESKAWPGRLAAAVKTGADLSLVPHVFFHWYLKKSGIRRFAGKNTLKAMDAAAAMIRRQMKGVVVSPEEWNRRRNDLNACWLFARSSRQERAALGARNALGATASTASTDALAALDALAARSGRRYSYDPAAKIFIEILTTAPVPAADEAREART